MSATIVADARRSARGFSRSFKPELLAEVGAKVLDRAETILRERLTGDDRARIRHEFSSSSGECAMSLPNSYAKALYLAAKEADGSPPVFDQLEDQMDAFVQLLRDNQVRKACLGPVVPAKKRWRRSSWSLKRQVLPRFLPIFLIMLAQQGTSSFLRQDHRSLQ